MPIPNLNRTFKNFQRLRQIINVFAKHGFGHILARMDLGRYGPKRWRLFRLHRLSETESIAPLSVPERLRLAFEELGPTFIKLGQILSTRPDLISTEWIEEFKKLRSHASVFPFSEVRAIIEGDLNHPLDQIFSAFDPVPFAAASIAQVHYATLQTGEVVVVKVQRPHIADIINTDLNLTKDFITVQLFAGNSSSVNRSLSASVNLTVRLYDENATAFLPAGRAGTFFLTTHSGAWNFTNATFASVPPGAPAGVYGWPRESA